LVSVEGFDIERIERLSRDCDKKEDRVLGMTYRVRVLETATEGCRKWKRTSRLSSDTAPSNDVAPPRLGAPAPVLAIEDGDEDDSSDSSSSSSSSHSKHRKKKHSKKSKSKKDKKDKKSKRDKKNDKRAKRGLPPAEDPLGST
jgi:hypothetical protein